MAPVTGPTMTVGIWSDMLYPADRQRQIAEILRTRDVPVDSVEIDSPHGHDTFLMNSDQLPEPIEQLLSTAAKASL